MKMPKIDIIKPYNSKNQSITNLPHRYVPLLVRQVIQDLIEVKLQNAKKICLLQTFSCYTLSTKGYVKSINY